MKAIITTGCLRMKILQPVNFPAFYVNTWHEATFSFWLLMPGDRCCPIHSDCPARYTAGGEWGALYAVCCQLPQSFFIPQDCKPIRGWVSILLSEDPVGQGIRLLAMLLWRGSLGLFLAEMWVACFPEEEKLQKQHQTKRGIFVRAGALFTMLISGKVIWEEGGNS